MNQQFQDDDILKGLLVFAPFYFVASSLLVGFNLALIAFILYLFVGFILYASRKIFTIPLQQIVFLLILSVSLILIMKMLLKAEYYSLAETIGLFMPLLLINSLILSVNNSIFVMSDIKAVSSSILKLAITASLFFIVFGVLHEIFSDISFFHSSASFFLIFGFLLALINQFKIKYMTSSVFNKSQV